MNMMWFIVERVAEIATIVLNMFFLYRTMNTKVGLSKQVIAGVTLLVVRMIYYSTGFGYRPYFTVLIGIVYAYFVFEGKFRTYAIWAILAVVIDGIVDALVASVFLMLPETSITLIGVPGLQRTIVTVTAKMLLFLAYYITAKKVDKNDNISIRDSVLLLLVPVGCWSLLEVLFRYSTKVSGVTAWPMMAAGSLALLLIIVSVVVLYSGITANGKELVHSKLQLHMSQMTQEHIEQINTLYMQLSAVRHDLHNHFSAIAGYLNAKDYPALEEYFSNLTDIDMDISEYVKHPVLNALISSRLAMATKENIEFTTNIMMPEHLPISDVDLCILVSNILDNAFDANKRAFEPRYIHLTAQPHNAYWAIACRNAVRERGNLRSSGCIKSTKNSEGIHGIGTRQVMEIAEKTGGFVTYRHKDYEFSTLVMLKMADG